MAPLPISFPTSLPLPGTATPLSQRPTLLASGSFTAFDRSLFTTHTLAKGRRDYYKIALITGSSCYHYASRGVRVDRPALVFSNPLIPYTWEPISLEQGGYLCLFTEEFFFADRARSLQDSPLFKLGSDPVYFVDETQYVDLSHLFKKIIQEKESGYCYRQDVVRNYLHLVLHEALKLRPQIIYYQPPKAASRIALLFQKLLEQQFPIESPSHGVQLRTPGDFARQLAVPVNHLNRAVQAHTGKSTSAHIATCLISEAKALLQHTNWNTTEIAYALGFEYPTYFNNFFKKQTGTTPLALRSQYLATIPAGVE